MSKFQLVLLIHAHQPVGNFEDVLERCYQQSYLPFVDVLARHPRIRIGLHYSGPLLEWMERAHPEYFEKLRKLVAKGQVEIVGGGFYEPILAVIPPKDCHAQITRLADYVEKHFEARPRGAWLAERIWEPQLPSNLAPAGVEYTLVDDNHFLGAGFELEQLHGYYLAEDQRHTVKVLPGLKALRYLIPFRGVPDVIAFLRDAATRHPGGFAAMGDDLEKFGSWPGTYDHCYTDGWLDQLFHGARDRFRVAGDFHAGTSGSFARAAGTRRSSDCFVHGNDGMGAAHGRAQPLSRACARVRIASATRCHFCAAECGGDFSPSIPNRIYLHKKMLHVSEKVGKLAESKRRDELFLESTREARHASAARTVQRRLLAWRFRRTLLAAFAHGRMAVADRSGNDRRPARRTARCTIKTCTKIDFDADGREDVYFTSDRYAALVQPADGGTISALDFRPVERLR